VRTNPQNRTKNPTGLPAGRMWPGELVARPAQIMSSLTPRSHTLSYAASRAFRLMKKLH